MCLCVCLWPAAWLPGVVSKVQAGGDLGVYPTGFLNLGAFFNRFSKFSDGFQQLFCEFEWILAKFEGCLTKFAKNHSNSQKTL